MIASLIRYVSDEAGTDDAMRLSVASLLRELLRGATDAMNRVKVEWVPLLFVGKHEPRSQKEIADAYKSPPELVARLRRLAGQ